MNDLTYSYTTSKEINVVKQWSIPFSPKKLNFIKVIAESDMD